MAPVSWSWALRILRACRVPGCCRAHSRYSITGHQLPLCLSTPAWPLPSLPPCMRRAGVRWTCSRQVTRVGPHDLLCVIGRRAPPGKCQIHPTQVKVRSRLIPFVPKESKCLLVVLWGEGELLQPAPCRPPRQVLGASMGPRGPSLAPLPSSLPGTL